VISVWKCKNDNRKRHYSLAVEIGKKIISVAHVERVKLQEMDAIQMSIAVRTAAFSYSI
jgi:hypothetical protein